MPRYVLDIFELANFLNNLKNSLYKLRFFFSNLGYGYNFRID